MILQYMKSFSYSSRTLFYAHFSVRIQADVNLVLKYNIKTYIYNKINVPKCKNVPKWIILSFTNKKNDKRDPYISTIITIIRKQRQSVPCLLTSKSHQSEPRKFYKRLHLFLFSIKVLRCLSQWLLMSIRQSPLRKRSWRVNRKCFK